MPIRERSHHLRSDRSTRRIQRRHGRPIALAELADDIQVRGLTQTTGVAIQAAALVRLSDVPVLAYGLVAWSGYRG